MRLLLPLLFLSLLLAISGCVNETEPVAETPKIDTVAAEPVAAITKGGNAVTFPEDGYQQYDPIAFIDYLKTNVDSGTVIIHKAPEGWIKRSHAKQLAGMLDNTEPCAGVILKNSGPNPPDNVQSSVAAEALLLLEAYRKNLSYPSQPGSLHFIKILQRSPHDADKLILLPQKHQVDEAKGWTTKL